MMGLSRKFAVNGTVPKKGSPELIFHDKRDGSLRGQSLKKE